MPEIIIESVDFRRAWDYVSSGKYDILKEYLSEKVHCLKKAGKSLGFEICCYDDDGALCARLEIIY